MARLSITLLGGFDARFESATALSLPTRKAQALLAYLALRPGHGQPRDKLASLLWGATGDRQARASLRQTLSALSKALAAADENVIVSEAGAVALVPTAGDVGVSAFEGAVAANTPEGPPRAATLSRGDLLEGLNVGEPPFEEWLASERERLRELAVDALAKRLRHLSDTGATEPAIRIALRALALDPLQEVVHRALMRLYARQGRRAAALRQYQLCLDVLARELRTEPEAETKKLYQQILESGSTAGTGVTPLALRCSSCGIQLPAGAKFCLECATPVGAPGSSSRFISPEAYTPKHLAERIINSKAALEGERKQITVLFADLKGSMELLADRDPEEARQLLDPVLELMMEAVHRYEGTVNQVMGDGIMALFGAPLAHEDHSVRACYAARRMQEAISQRAEDMLRQQGVRIQIRIGLNSG